MNRIQLSIAIGDYEHTRDVITGRVPVEGIELLPSVLPPEEVFHRFSIYREWDISEMSMGRYVSMVSQGDHSLTAIPIFISRVFRHSMIYLRDDSLISDPRQLKGKRIGVPEWAQTATIYMRGMLAHDFDVALDSVDWVQGGVNDPGREEQVPLRLPSGVKVRVETAKSLNELLLAGELDTVLSARPPAGFGHGLRRLYEDHETAELAYYKATGIFPIMHVAVIRTEVLERHPWVAMNLMKAFEEGKQRSLERLSEIVASHVPLPGLQGHVDRLKRLFGEDFWPYGLEPNRVTLEAFLQFAHEQGVSHELLAPEALFAKQTLSTVKI